MEAKARIGLQCHLRRKTVKTALFWVITHRIAVIYYRRFGTTYPSHPTTSVRNYHYLLHNNPEAHTSHLLRGGILKSFKKNMFTTLFDETQGSISYR